jgi:hypothetical protein
MDVFRDGHFGDGGLHSNEQVKKLALILILVSGACFGQDSFYFKAARQASTIDITINLFAHYEVDGNGNDKLGNHNATVTNATYNASGKIDQSLDMDGDSDDLTIPDDDAFSFDGGQPFSIALWVKVDAPSATDLFVSKRAGANTHEYQLYRTSNDLGFQIYDGDTSDYLQVLHAWSPSLDTWYHIVATHDGSETNAGMKLYVNGSNVSTTNSNSGTFTAMVNGTSDVHVGIFGPAPANAAAWDGEGDSLRFYNEELTADKVQAIYDAEN